MTSLDRTNVRLLVVEDNPRYLKQLKRWMNKFGYQDIESARDVVEAQAKLDEKPFDVIVADMRLDGNAEGGFAVLHEKVTERNITSVIIILTANDTVADCRRAFKEGAWDYICKSMKGNVFEELDKSIREAITYFNLRGNDKDEAWIEDNMSSLLQSYDGHYIAVINNRVIAAAESEAALKQQLRDKKYPVFMPIIQKIEALGKPKPSIADLIQLGESETLEFKSSLRWDVRQNKVNKKLHFAVLKTIAAFLNSEGGTLLIGVQDDGSIFGLEQDIAGVKGKSLDGFERTLMDLIKDHIGARFAGLIKVRFDKLDGKDVCAVEVKKADDPVFMNDQHKKFYIRLGCTTQAPNPEEMYHYIQRHWSVVSSAV
ncbi:MAG: RNA-binding domain-containing protein [Ardenticatenaceae bacterium]